MITPAAGITTSAWWTDRVLPGVIVSVVWAALVALSHARLLHRIRAHIDQVTRDQDKRIEQITAAQNAHIDRVTAKQSRHIQEITDAQTQTLTAARALQGDGDGDAAV